MVSVCLERYGATAGCKIVKADYDQGQPHSTKVPSDSMRSCAMRLNAGVFLGYAVSKTKPCFTRCQPESYSFKGIME